MSAIYDKDGIGGPFEKAISKPLKAPSWPRCSLCFKPAKPSERCVDTDGLVYCSQSCVFAKEEGGRESATLVQVLARDHGICATCGLDCIELRRTFDGLVRLADAGDYMAVNDLVARARGFKGFPYSQLAKLGFALWASDHIVEKAAGGSDRLENRQTLCLSCHAAKTKGFAKKRAKLRRSR